MQEKEWLKELSKLESVWKRREITNPEKAAKILAYIIDARQVFQTEASRKEYDARLEEAQNKVTDQQDGEKEAEWERSGLMWFVNSHWANSDFRELARKYRKKGQALYERLKEIVDRSITYIEECKRINKEYEAELELLKEKVAEEYRKKREMLISEKKEKLDEATRNEADRIFLQNDISSMRSELSTLGFFSGKRKKELEFKIAKTEQQLSCLQTVEQVELIYQKKLDEITRTAPGQLSILGYDDDLSGVFAPFASLSEGESKQLMLVTDKKEFEEYLNYIRQQIQDIQNVIQGRSNSLLEFRSSIKRPVEGYKLVVISLDMGMVEQNMRSILALLMRSGPAFGISFLVISTTLISIQTSSGKDIELSVEAIAPNITILDVSGNT